MHLKHSLLHTQRNTWPRSHPLQKSTKSKCFLHFTTEKKRVKTEEVLSPLLFPLFAMAVLHSWKDGFEVTGLSFSIFTLLDFLASFLYVSAVIVEVQWSDNGQ